MTKLITNSDFRDWNYKTAAPLSYVGALLDNFVFEIPRQNQKIVAPRLVDSVGRMNWNMCAGKELTLFVGIAIYSIIYKIVPDSAIVEESVPLSRCSVSDDRLVFPLCRNQKG